MADMQTIPVDVANDPVALSISMNIGTTIRGYRLQKGMSQGDIEKRTGLLRCYLSRVENGHTVPSLETLQKIARALDLPAMPRVVRSKSRSCRGLRGDSCLRYYLSPRRFGIATVRATLWFRMGSGLDSELDRKTSCRERV